MFSKIKPYKLHIMGAASALMLAWLAYDFFSAPTPAPIRQSDAEFTMVNQKDSTPEPLPDTVAPLTPITPDKAKPAQPSPEPEVAANVQTAEPVSIQVPMVSEVTFTLSDQTQTILDELEKTYLSEVQTARRDAEHQALLSQRQLDGLTAVVNPKPVTTRPMTRPWIDTIKVRSLVKAGNRITAWVEVNDGQARPILPGAWVGNVQAVDITAEFVRFVTKEGNAVTKYVEAPQPPISEEENNGKVR